MIFSRAQREQLIRVAARVHELKTQLAKSEAEFDRLWREPEEWERIPPSIDDAEPPARKEEGTRD